MRIPNLSYLITLAVVLIVIWVGWKLTSRNAYESAEYSVLQAEGPIELRQYPDLMLAATRMNALPDEDSRAGDGSFGRLFNYISGGNEQQQKVAMTTPVFMGAGESEGDAQMGFVIPKKIAADGVPAPSNQLVGITRRSGGKFAVIRFAGRMDGNTIEANRQVLEEWIQAEGLKIIGEAEMAGYDPPWTPGMFRRNEILLRVE